MSLTHDLFIRGSKRVADQAKSLLDNVPADQYVLQPGGVVNHPAWTLSHLVHYHPAILSLLRNQPVTDPANTPKADLYDEGSTPQSDVTLYLPGDELLAAYLHGHEQILAVLQQAPEDYFARKPGLDRWAKAFPTVADNLVYLILLHESQHLGQVMAWRRALKST